MRERGDVDRVARRVPHARSRRRRRRPRRRHGRRVDPRGSAGARALGRAPRRRSALPRSSGPNRRRSTSEGSSSSRTLRGRLRSVKGLVSGDRRRALGRRHRDRAPRARARLAARRADASCAFPSGDYVEVEERIRRIVAGLSARRAAATSPRCGSIPRRVDHAARARRAGQRLRGRRGGRGVARRAWSELPSLTFPVPASLRAELRPYQVEGYRWLCRLAELGLGACLADDMGLGKTLQIVALLLTRSHVGPALVVAPTSVCANWAREMKRFAPVAHAAWNTSAKIAPSLARNSSRTTARRQGRHLQLRLAPTGRGRARRDRLGHGRARRSAVHQERGVAASARGLPALRQAAHRRDGHAGGEPLRRPVEHLPVPEPGLARRVGAVQADASCSPWSATGAPRPRPRSAPDRALRAAAAEARRAHRFAAPHRGAARRALSEGRSAPLRAPAQADPRQALHVARQASKQDPGLGRDHAPSQVLLSPAARVPGRRPRVGRRSNVPGPRLRAPRKRTSRAGLQSIRRLPELGARAARRARASRYEYLDGSTPQAARPARVDAFQNGSAPACSSSASKPAASA